MTLNEPLLSSVTDLRAGAMASEHVRLVRQIGEGGMASVWLADHLGLETQVAVKFMSPALACCPAAVERFTREAKAAAHIRHRHVVQIFDSGVQSPMAGGLPYIVMEYLEGRDLETRLHDRGRMSLKDAALVVLQTSRALEKAHELGVVHRDIKAENIFLCGDDDDEPFVKVLDFGIAKTPNDGTVRATTTGTLGTPSYMSPEQMLSAKTVDYRCDLWALAVVAYYEVTGKLPFPGETYGAICLAVNRGRFPMPARLRNSVPEALNAWFRRALARDPKSRFTSARELGATFAAAIEGSPVGDAPKLTPFTSRSTLMGSSVTNSGVHEQTSRLVRLVAASALAAGAFLALAFARGDWARLAAHPAAVAAPVAAQVAAPVDVAAPDAAQVVAPVDVAAPVAAQVITPAVARIVQPAVPATTLATPTRSEAARAPVAKAPRQPRGAPATVLELSSVISSRH
jgi:eukaryotic-like serine/threonine-protein kinase